MKRFLLLLLLQLIGNAVLLGLAYYWLGVGEADAASLAGSAALIVIVVCGAIWLHGTSLAYFRDPQTGLMDSVLKRPVGRVLPLLLLSLAAGALYIAITYWNSEAANAVNRTSSYLSMTLQTPVRPARVKATFDVLVWIVRWVLIPVLFLPVASGIAARGWRGVGELGSNLKNWRMWALVPLSLLAAIWAPLKLISWIPPLSSFGMELISVVARISCAYLLFVGACLFAAFVTSRGKPSASQPSTTVSP
jgi:hypothetical protein